MPTYTYRCVVCEHTFDVKHGVNDPAVEKCEKCGEKVKKVFHAVGIQFVGSGFHVNDYSKNSCSSGSCGSAPEKNETGVCPLGAPCSKI